MQFKFITVAALATLAAATPVRRDQCDTGSLQCCQSVQDTHNTHNTPNTPNDLVFGLLRLLGIAVSDITAPIGLTCSPITVGVAGNSCTAQPVCCENNSFDGVVALGCTPININL
ncbi:hypothetical protein D9758_008656 [Tetrapyrgos nigripes]|uniref:Hydrophobin n=1 Tax=Tetrapyrgos nigripes TaxID=182062 RepID=A0A8H5D567_9AGAR|nr:hypothetical protein D9758_008656 [Tetrapyrgos nigripes]